MTRSRHLTDSADFLRTVGLFLGGGAALGALLLELGWFTLGLPAARVETSGILTLLVAILGAILGTLPGLVLAIRKTCRQLHVRRTFAATARQRSLRRLSDSNVHRGSLAPIDSLRC